MRKELIAFAAFLLEAALFGNRFHWWRRLAIGIPPVIFWLVFPILAVAEGASHVPSELSHLMPEVANCGLFAVACLLAVGFMWRSHEKMREKMMKQNDLLFDAFLKERTETALLRARGVSE